MKGWMKGMLIASAVCVGAGTAMCASAWAMGGRFSRFLHRRIGVVEEAIPAQPIYPQPQGAGAAESQESPEGQNSGKAQESTDEAAKSAAAESPDRTALFGGSVVAKLEIEAAGGKIEIITEDGAESIRVICENEAYECYQRVEGDTLEIKIERYTKKDRPFWENLDQLAQLEDQWEETAAQIIIPAGSHFRQADLEVSGGAMTVDYLYADSLDLKAAGGLLSVQEGIAGKLNGECMAGSLVYQGQVLQKMDAECEAGSIRYLLEGEEGDFNYELEAEVGSILIDGTEQGNMTDEAALRNGGAVKRADLECSAGKIEIDFYQP